MKHRTSAEVDQDIVAGSQACTQCGVRKPFSEFYPMKDHRTGLRPHCKKCDTQRVLARRERMKVEEPEAWMAERRRATRTHLLRTYGITQEEYDRLLAIQGGVCAICARPERRRRTGVVILLAVDHDHSCCQGRNSCGRCVRGLLCDDCNAGIGRFNDSTDRLISAVAYLMRGESDED